MKWFGKRNRERRKLSREDRKKNKALAERAAVWTAFSASAQPPAQNAGLAGKGGGFDISNQQKIAAYNLLMNTKDE